MIERPIGFVALSLPFVAVVVEALTKFPGDSGIAIAISAALCLAIAATSVELAAPFELASVLPFAVLLAVGFGAWADPSLVGPWGPEIVAGALFGVPWLFAGYVARAEEALGARLVVFGVAVTWGLLLLADAPVPTLGGYGASEHFVGRFFALASQQFSVFGGLVPGGAAPTLPLNATFDAAYAALTAVALGGLLLVAVRPQTGDRVPLPVAVRAFREADVPREAVAAYGFTPGQLEVLRDRSTGESPFLTWPPGLEPIFYGAGTAAAFLAAAYFASIWAVLGLTVGIAIAVLAFVRFTERPLAVATARRPRRRPAVPTTVGAEIDPGVPPATPGEAAAGTAAPEPSPGP